MAKMVSDSWVMAGVRDLKRSVGFYAKLGLKPSMRMPSYFELKVPGGTVLGLHAMGGGKCSREKCRCRHSVRVCERCRKIDDWLRAAGGHDR